jgi:hypothetical protein
LLRDLRDLFTLELSRFRRLKVMDIDLGEPVQVAVLLNSLPDKYEPMVLAWEAADAAPTLEDISAKLLNAAKRDDNNSDGAMNAWVKNFTCFKRGI